MSIGTKSSRSAWSWCGAIFDVARHRELLSQLERKISQPGFWSDPQQAQRVLQERKQAEERLNAEQQLARLASDIETYLHLAHEEKDPTARQSVIEETARELDKAGAYVAEQETATLLSGENDHRNAIMTIKPGAGGTESQDWAEMLLRMYLRWAERRGWARRWWTAAKGKRRGSSRPRCWWRARTLMDSW